MARLVSTRSGLFLGAIVLAQLGALSCATLRGSVTCLDCAAGHDLSGVVVAVQCRDVEGDSAGLYYAAQSQTDGGGNFDVTMPEAPASRRCAARVLGATEQLCAPQRLTLARIVAGREPGSYALRSRLAVFTRCGALATMATGGGDKRPPPKTPAPRSPSPPVRSPPRAGLGSPPYGLGIPLIYVFPFIPIIGIP